MHMFFQFQDEGGGETQAPAGDGPGAPAEQQGSPWVMMVPLLLMFVVIYFMMIRPQRRQAKERENMISNLKKDDHVLTNGGIYAVAQRAPRPWRELLGPVHPAGRRSDAPVGRPADDRAGAPGCPGPPPLHLVRCTVCAPTRAAGMEGRGRPREPG